VSVGWSGNCGYIWDINNLKQKFSYLFLDKYVTFNEKTMNNLEKIFPKYSEKQIEKFADEDEYMDAYVELLKQTIQSFWQVVQLKYCDEFGKPMTIDKENAVLGGNIIRLLKLSTSYLQNICEGKSEICYIIGRSLAETAINLKYMLIEGEERVKRNYIKHSLITEKELWETIKLNITERSGNTLNIEKRMQKSIENSFDKSDFEIDDINRSSKWKSIKSRADVVAGEMFYSVFYGIGSHAVHGNWQDVLMNNLEKSDNNFKLQFDWNIPKPQMLDGPIIFNLDLLQTFTEKELTFHECTEIIKENYTTLLSYQQSLMKNHEVLLAKKNSL